MKRTKKWREEREEVFMNFNYKAFCPANLDRMHFITPATTCSGKNKIHKTCEKMPACLTARVSFQVNTLFP